MDVSNIKESQENWLGEETRVRVPCEPSGNQRARGFEV